MPAVACELLRLAARGYLISYEYGMPISSSDPCCLHAGDEDVDRDRRSWDVLAALADGLSTRDIGRRLHLKQSGVRAHMSAVVRKLGVADREDAIAFFRETTRT